MVKWTQKNDMKSGTTTWNHGFESLYYSRTMPTLSYAGTKPKIDILLYNSRKLALISNMLIRKISYAGICNLSFGLFS